MARSRFRIVTVGAVLLLVVAAVVLSGPGLNSEPRSAEAAVLNAAKKLHPSDATGGFGTSTAVSGDTALIGAHNDDEAGQNAGAVYIFERDLGGASNWGEVKKIFASDDGRLALREQRGDQRRYGGRRYVGQSWLHGRSLRLPARPRRSGNCRSRG